MRVSINKSLLENDGTIKLFEFDECPGILNEDLLKAITGAGAAILAVGLTKAVAAHNLMALKKYMKTVVDLAINGKGKKWNEPSYKSITNDEKRNALMITYQLAKYAGIYDYSKDGSSMINSHISMPNIPGGSVENFRELLKKKTKWFGLKTVSDPVKNIKSIKPESEEDPNPYFTSILEQYRNALYRVFGESEAKKITNAINSYKGKSMSDLDSIKKKLIGIFDDAIAASDMSKYTIFKDLNKALDALIDSYDKNIREAITNNRTILDKKLKKDGLIALWTKYSNILRTNKQQFIDDFNKSPEYTYLRDFLRGTMISLLVDLLQKCSEEESEEETTEEDIPTPEPTPVPSPGDDIVEDFSVRFESVKKDTRADESYQFGSLINKLYEDEFGEEPKESVDEVDLILESSSDKPLGKIVCIVKSSENGQTESVISETKKEVFTEFEDSDNENHLSFADTDMVSFPCYLNEGGENETKWTKRLKLSDLADSIGFDKESVPNLICVAYPLDEDSNLIKEDLDKDKTATWNYEEGSKPVEDDTTDDETDDEEEHEDPVNPVNTPKDDEEQEENDDKKLDFTLLVNSVEILTDLTEAENKSDNGKILSPNDYGLRFGSSSDELKSAIVIFSKEPVKEYKDIIKASKDKENYLMALRFLKSSEEDFAVEGSYYMKEDSFKKGNWKFVTVIPRNTDSSNIKKEDVLFDLGKSGWFEDWKFDTPKDEKEDSQEEPKNLPAVIPSGAITPSGQFKIDLKGENELVLDYKKCVAVLAKYESFFKDMSKENEEVFKKNIDAIPYNKKDAFKVLASADNYAAVYINFGDDTTAIKGIKFAPDFIEFNPNDEIWFKFYPVREVDGHLELNIDRASQVGHYKFNGNEEPKKIGNVNPVALLTNDQAFKIELNPSDKEVANKFKKCIVVLSRDKQFLETMTSDNDLTFKRNVDSIKYVQPDKFKILAMKENFAVILINFGDNTTAVKGIKFQPGFIKFQPGDSIWFRIYPVEVNEEHLNLILELGSPIGEYTMKNQAAPKQNDKALNNQKMLSNSQK